jgi:hypothetical protein
MNRTRTLAAGILLSFGLTLGLCLVPGTARAAEPVAPVSVTAAETTPAANTSEEDELASLEAREAAAPELQTFEGGGDTLYISSGALVLILVIVILVIIL